MNVNPAYKITDFVETKNGDCVVIERVELVPVYFADNGEKYLESEIERLIF
jgi:hypothetical protein